MSWTTRTGDIATRDAIALAGRGVLIAPHEIDGELVLRYARQCEICPRAARTLVISL
jgi:hypothetical protein